MGMPSSDKIALILNTGLLISLKKLQKSLTHFMPLIFFDNPMKTSENLWCFQGVSKEISGMKWVNRNLHFLCGEYSLLFVFLLFKLWKALKAEPWRRTPLDTDTEPQLLYQLDIWRELNVHKTFRRRPERLLPVLCTFNLLSVYKENELTK